MNKKRFITGERNIYNANLKTGGSYQIAGATFLSLSYIEQGENRKMFLTFEKY